MKSAGHIDSNRSDAISAYHSKQLMNVGRGMVVTSEEAILEDEKKLTHWTPNTYRFETYTGEYRAAIKDYSKKNLSQINTFVIDIDSEESRQGEIVLTYLDQVGYMPTLILESKHGYQVYFVSKIPSYVTRKSNFKVIDVAKKISKTIRLRLAERLSGVDPECNHFGTAWFLQENNVVF